MPIANVKNGSFSAADLPQDMAKVVCKRRASWRTIRPYRLRRKWTTAFGTMENPSKAYALLRERLISSINIVHGGNHGLIRLVPAKKYTAALGNLSKEQAELLCKHIKATAKSCRLISPTEMQKITDKDNAYYAALEAKRKAAAKRKAKKRKKSRKKKKKKKKTAKAKS